jgi:hypothetical protein
MPGSREGLSKHESWGRNFKPAEKKIFCNVTEAFVLKYI